MSNVLHMCCCSVVSTYCTSVLLRAIAAVRPDIYDLKRYFAVMGTLQEYVQVVEQVFCLKLVGAALIEAL
jgi:hypothetical protein